MTSTIYPSTRCYMTLGTTTQFGQRINMEPERNLVTIVGGETCLRDPDDHSSYMEFKPSSVLLTAPALYGYVNVTVEFEDLPELEPFDLLEVHLVGFANGDYGIGGSGIGVAWLPPRYYSDYTTEYQQPDTLFFMGGLPAFQNNVPYSTPEDSPLRVPQDVNYRATAWEQFFDDERFSNPSSFYLACYRGGSYGGGFRMYGAYLRVTKGVNPGSERLPFAPGHAFALYNSGFVVMSADGSKSMVNGNNNGEGRQAPQVLFEDGSVVQLSPDGLFSVQRPTQDYAYAGPILTEQQRADLGGSFAYLTSLVANAEKGTFIVAALISYFDTAWHYKGVFYEYTKECRLLRTIEVDGDSGAYYDAATPLPTHGGVVNDQLTFMGGADGAMSNATDEMDFAAVYRLDLKTGVFTILVDEATADMRSTDDPTFPGWTATMCLLPFGEHDIITASGYSSGEGTAFGAHPQGTLDMWFQRWSYDGEWLGTLGFYYDPDYAWGGPFNMIGGMTSDEQGLLTFSYVGNLYPPLQPVEYGNEYDGLVQIDSSLIPSDGTVKYADPLTSLKRLWQTGTGIQEGIQFHLASPIKPYNSSESGDTRVRFQ